MSGTSSQATRSRRWCGTLNNYTDADLVKIGTALPALKYGIVGKETGESGTPHLQAFFIFRSGKTMSAIKTLLGSDRWHFEAARGTWQQNVEYCSKEGTVRVIEYHDIS